MSFRLFIQKVWEKHGQFIRYFIIGSTGVVLDLGSLYFFTQILQISQTIALVIYQPFIILYIFFLNKHWSFKNQKGGLTHRQMIRFLTLCTFNYFFSIAWIWLWSEHFAFDHFLARISNIMLAVGWNFLLYKYWVYKSGE